MFSVLKSPNYSIHRQSNRFLVSALCVAIISPFSLFSAQASANSSHDIYSTSAQCTQLSANTDYGNSFMTSVAGGDFTNDNASGWLDSSRAWIREGSDTAGWYGFVFDGPKRISGIKTKGRSDSDSWVTSYKIEATKTAFTGSFVANDAANVVSNTTWAQSATWVDLGSFEGNDDQHSIVSHVTDNRDADWTAVRITPLSFHNNAALRLAIESCESNLKMWLNSESGVYKFDGVTAPANDNQVYHWLDSSGHNNHAKENSFHGGVASTRQPKFKKNTGNFHKAINFDGTFGSETTNQKYSMGLHLGSNRLYSTNNGYSIYAVAIAKSSSGSTRSIFDFGNVAGNGAGLAAERSHFKTYVSTNKGGRLLNKELDSLINESTPTLMSSSVIFNDSISLSLNAIEVATGSVSLSQFSTGEVNTSNVYGGSSKGPVSIGRQSKNNNFVSQARMFEGNILEVMFIDEALTTAQKKRIDSYLALKHGITLDSTFGSYVSSNDDVLWDDQSYWNHITGIGKDNASGLDQRISKSQDIGSSRSLIISTDDDFSSTNADHQDTISNNSFLVFGSDGAGRSGNKTGDLDTTKYYKRVIREWKVVNTNFTGTVHLNFTNTPNRNGRRRVLLWDANGNFNTGSVELGYSFTREFSVTNIPSGYLALAFADHYPTAADKTLTLNENSSVTLQSSDFGFNDLLETNSLQSITLTALPALGSFKLNGTDVSVNQVIDEADIANLVYAPDLDASGDGYAAFSFTVNNGDASSQSANTITFDVVNVNNAPKISGAPDTSVFEDSPYLFVPSVTDSDIGDSKVFGVVGKPNWATFNTVTGQLSGTPTNSDIGIANNIIISVTDGEGATGSLTAFSIEVVNTNDAPVITGTPDLSVNEDSVYLFIPAVVDVDSGDTKVFSITNKPIWASFSTVSGQLSGTPDNSHVASYPNITITVADAAGATDAIGPFAIDVINVNDAPVLSGSPAISVNELIAYSFTPTLTDSDASDSHTFSIINKPSWASFDTSDGTLSGTPGPSHLGTASNIVISVNDGAGGSDSLTAFNITVANVNDAPTISGNPSSTVNEDATYQFTPNVADIDPNDNHTFSITNKPVWASFDNATGKLSGVPTNDHVATYAAISISVADDGGLSSVLLPFSIEVVNTNDAPTITGAPATTIAQGQAYSFAPTIDDIDNGDGYSVAIVNQHGLVLILQLVCYRVHQPMAM